MHITEGRTYVRIAGTKDGHTDIRTDPNCIVIKDFMTIFFRLLQYPVIWY